MTESTPRVFASVDEVVAAAGLQLGPSEPLKIDQQRVDGFAEVTDDHQWIHVDVERSADGPWGGTIAHGFLTLSLVPRFARLLYRFEFGGARLNYGLDKVRFPAPVPTGSVLRASATIGSVRPNPAGTIITTNVVITVEGAGKPSCIADLLVLVTQGER
ncbi:MaoC family dehydratase [Amycolatopsis pigmentata]|uniref:MaoC family dehydratase n=1 Tax=Amycolatopsis pigmentata TaxID=450801 RepID=A0ABW5G6F2_9PSEU